MPAGVAGVVAGGKIVAVMRAAAFFALESALDDGGCHSSERARLMHATIPGARVRSLHPLRQFAPISVGKQLAVAQQAGMQPHVLLQARDVRLDLWESCELSLRGLRSCRNSIRLFAHGASSTRAEDEPFQQRVAGQPVGAVDAGTGDLARCIKSRQRGPRIDVCAYATHQVMCSRAHRDEVATETEAMLAKKAGNAGKALHQVDASDVAHVEVHRQEFAGAAAEAFTRNGASYDIARREFEQRVVALHKAIAACVPKVGALAAQGFG